jgi:hypothetical protein
MTVYQMLIRKAHLSDGYRAAAALNQESYRRLREAKLLYGHNTLKSHKHFEKVKMQMAREATAVIRSL